VSLLADLAQGGLLGFTAAATPGPFQALLVARSLRAGPLRALPLALVPLVSDTVVVATVLAVLSQLPAGFLRALTALGLVVIVWLAVGTLRAAGRAEDPAERALGAPRGLLPALLVNVTSPGAWLFWSMVGGPLLAAAWHASASHALAFLAGFYACISGGNAALVLLAGGIARAGPRAARALGYASGLALLGFAGWQGWRLCAPLVHG
jgi:threonine/homoserine/homoserine lactone efflux protein